jgi:hypothetical protein
LQGIDGRYIRFAHSADAIVGIDIVADEAKVRQPRAS